MSKGRHSRIFGLWRRDPRCHWCRRPTVLIFRPPGCGQSTVPARADEATIDHLWTRFDGRTQTHNVEVTVLACRECNGKRGACREAKVPLDELHRRAGNGGTNRERGQR